MGWSSQPYAKPPTLEDNGIPFWLDYHLWPGRNGTPYQQLRYRIILGFIWARRPQHYFKVEIPAGGFRVCVLYIRSTMIVKRSIPRFLRIYTFKGSRLQWYAACLASCNYVWMYSSLAPQRLGEFYAYSLFKSLSITGRCSENMNVLAPKSRILQTAPKTQIGDFLENGSNNSDYI
jgi:hypothetical protein